MIEICWNNNSTAGNSTVRGSTTSAARTLYLKTNVSVGGVCANTTGTKSTSRPNMRFAFSSSALKMADETSEEIATEEVNEPIQEALSMNIYPNPTAQFATIELDGEIAANATLTIFDVTGKQVFTDKMNTNTYELAVENYTPGIYLVVITNGNNHLNQKLIVKKEF